MERPAEGRAEAPAPAGAERRQGRPAPAEWRQVRLIRPWTPRPRPALARRDPAGTIARIRPPQPRGTVIMQSLAICYFKRYKMEVAPRRPARRPFPSRLPRPALVAGPARRRTPTSSPAASAARSMPSVFPSLGQREGCRGLMTEVVRRRAFIPEATWLVVGPDGARAAPCRRCASAPASPPSRTSASCRRAAAGGLGEALLLQALHGMYDAGLGRAVLEVTAAQRGRRSPLPPARLPPRARSSTRLCPRKVRAQYVGRRKAVKPLPCLVSFVLYP